MGRFLDWFEAAHEAFGRPGEYPLIDDTTVLAGDPGFEYWPWKADRREHNAEELRELALTADHGDPAIRFVYLNLFYRLAHYPAEQIASLVEDRDEAADHRAHFAQDLRALIRLVDPSSCPDARLLRWDIVNACAVSDWERAARLYARFEETAGLPPAVVAGLRGRCSLLSVFAEPWGLAELGLLFWALSVIRA